jgi:threonine dehydrogenase-like Zn-dependent dehydrogenase
MYEGRTDIENGRVLGHENLGQVIEVGKAVELIKVGDWVCMPFNVSCGCCQNCESGQTSACLTLNPGKVGAAYGYADMGPFEGGQAELLRVPHGDFNCLKLPNNAEELQNDYVMLSDIFPTGYHATELANLQPGESVVVYGAGPVGLMAAYSTVIRGAGRVMIVDRLRDRLALAEKIGVTTIDDSKVDPVEAVLEWTEGKGADKGCECVGYHAHDPRGKEHNNMTMNNLIKSVRATGTIGVVGVYAPEDPKSSDKLAKNGQVAMDWGALWGKGLRIGTGQTNVKNYNRRLCRLIESGKATPSFIISHALPLEKAPEAYQHFDAREDGWTKVVLKPGK